MQQLFSQSMEFRCIMTLTASKIPESVRSSLLGKLSPEFFSYPPCKAAFTRIQTIAKKRFEIIDFADLVEDPALDEDFREILRDIDAKPASSKKKIKSMLETLDKYRKIRIAYEAARHVMEKLEGENVDIDAVLDKMSTNIAHARRDIDEEQHFVMIGKNDNSEDLMEQVLQPTRDETIPTGFRDYDKRNGGLPEEGVFIMAATTSGGKSAVSMNLLKNLYLGQNKNVCRVSMEMGDKQETQRFLSMISGVSFSKIKHNKLSPKEKQRIRRAREEFKQHGIKNDCLYSSVSPTRSLTAEDALRMIKPFGFHVAALDYISLFEGVDVDNQWMMLSAIARTCKVFSRENKMLVIILCQLDDATDKLRYSKGIKEHADVMWSWNYSKKEQRELKILPVNVDKARDGELFSFDLAERFEVMSVENMSADGDYSESDAEGSDEDIDLSSSKTSGGKKSSKFLEDSQDDELEDDYAVS